MSHIRQYDMANRILSRTLNISECKLQTRNSFWVMGFPIGNIAHIIIVANE